MKVDPVLISFFLHLVPALCNMTSSPLLLLLLLLTTPFTLSLNATNTSSLQLNCATSKSPRRTASPQTSGPSFVPSVAFLSTLKSTLDQINQLTSLISSFSGSLGGDLRLSSALSDCLDLLDLSSDELTSTLSASQPTTTSTSGTGNRGSDVRSWMSAALGNQDTCKESLSGAGGIIGDLVSDGLDMVTSLVADGLRQVSSSAPGSGGKGGGGGRRLMGFPEWVSAGDRRLLQAQPAGVETNAVVAKDGSGNYTTVSAAVAAAPTESAARYVIYVKKGVYKENVEIKKKKWNLMIVGDGMGRTVISGSRSFVDGWTTYRSATFAVAAKGFIMRDLTVENTAGPEKHQAVALRSDSDLSVYYRCEFTGYQDTLYAHSLRQFFRECRVSGTVDFVFGNAAAVFQSCQIGARLPLPDQKNTVTAQGRKDPNQNTGFAFQFCNVTADADLAAANSSSTATYLGRPWKEYSRTVLMQSYLGAVVRPEGWLPWSADFALKTLYYGEYMNYGPGSGLAGRVTWPGYHVLTDAASAANFTVAQFIDGNLWLPSTGVKYTAGLTSMPEKSILLLLLSHCGELMAPTSLEVVFTLPDSQRLTFRTHYSRLLNPEEWQIVVGAVVDEIYRKASINLSGFQQGIRDISRLANGDPSFVDSETAEVRIELWISAFRVAEDDSIDDATDDSGDDDDATDDSGDDVDATDDSGDDDDATDDSGDDDDATDGSDSDSDSGEESDQVDGLTRDLESFALNRAMERSFQESLDQAPSFGGTPASREALASFKYFTAEEGERGAAATVCTVCLEVMLRGVQVCRTPCMHVFHDSCLCRWLEVSRLCPLCRFKLQC